MPLRGQVRRLESRVRFPLIPLRPSHSSKYTDSVSSRQHAHRAGHDRQAGILARARARVCPDRVGLRGRTRRRIRQPQSSRCTVSRVWLSARAVAGFGRRGAVCARASRRTSADRSWRRRSDQMRRRYRYRLILHVGCTMNDLSRYSVPRCALRFVVLFDIVASFEAFRAKSRRDVNQHRERALFRPDHAAPSADRRGCSGEPRASRLAMPRARPPSSPSSLAAAAAVTAASTSTSTTSTILNHTYAPFYACYLLKSYNPKRLNQTYIGSTPDPPRRWRQHMGETVGGVSLTPLIQRPVQSRLRCITARLCYGLCL